MPETLFGLIPGIGAYSYLVRRTNPGLAERMVMSGSLYSARRPLPGGAWWISSCADGCGMEALYSFMSRDQIPPPASSSPIYDLRRQVNPIPQAELDAAASAWARSGARPVWKRDFTRMMRRVARRPVSRTGPVRGR